MSGVLMNNSTPSASQGHPSYSSRKCPRRNLRGAANGSELDSTKLGSAFDEGELLSVGPNAATSLLWDQSNGRPVKYRRKAQGHHRPRILVTKVALTCFFLGVESSTHGFFVVQLPGLVGQSHGRFAPARARWRQPELRNRRAQATFSVHYEESLLVA